VEIQNSKHPAGEVSRAWWLLLLGFGIMFSLSTGILSSFRSRTVVAGGPQPIEFNHRLHIEEVGLECTDCHESFESETFSGMPTAETCAFCHEEATGESPEEARLVKLLQEGSPLVWQPLFRQPSHVFYSHRRHVGVAGIECEVCHGKFASKQRPPRRVRRLTMDDCLQCHQEGGVASDCTTCHR